MTNHTKVYPEFYDDLPTLDLDDLAIYTFEEYPSYHGVRSTILEIARRLNVKFKILWSKSKLKLYILRIE